MVKERVVNADEVQNLVFQNFGNTKLSMRTIGNGDTMIFTREIEEPKKKRPMTLEEAFGTLPGLGPFVREDCGG